MLQTPLPRRGRRMLGIGALSVFVFATFLAACASDAPASDSSDPAATASDQQRQNLSNAITTIRTDSVLQTAPIKNLTDLLPGLIVQRTSRVHGQQRQQNLGNAITTIAAYNVPRGRRRTQ